MITPITDRHPYGGTWTCEHSEHGHPCTAEATTLVELPMEHDYPTLFRFCKQHATPHAITSLETIQRELEDSKTHARLYYGGAHWAILIGLGAGLYQHSQEPFWIGVATAFPFILIGAMVTRTATKRGYDQHLDILEVWQSADQTNNAS